MNTINNIPRTGLWSDSTSKIDGNFMIFEDELNKIESDAQKCKGLFPSLSSLQSEHPSPAVGSWAYVGSSLPALIYVYRSPGGWTSTGKSGGGNLDPSKYANSKQLSGNADILFTTKTTWIQSNNNGSSWNNVTENKLKLSVDAPNYIFRLSGLTYGEDGELLEPTTTDPYLSKFKKGSFVSMTLLSSDGVSKTYTANTLSWTIDKTFYKKTVSGVVQDRLPVEGDTMRATLRFKSPSSGNKEIPYITVFKFSN